MVVDSRDLIITELDFSAHSKIMEYFKEEYVKALEEIDADLPNPLVEEMGITVFVDSDHNHDKATCRSITGLFFFFLLVRPPRFQSLLIMGWCSSKPE